MDERKFHILTDSYCEFWRVLSSKDLVSLGILLNTMKMYIACRERGFYILRQKNTFNEWHIKGDLSFIWLKPFNIFKMPKGKIIKGFINNDKLSLYSKDELFFEADLGSVQFFKLEPIRYTIKLNHSQLRRLLSKDIRDSVSPEVDLNVTVNKESINVKVGEVSSRISIRAKSEWNVNIPNSWHFIDNIDLGIKLMSSLKIKFKDVVYNIGCLDDLIIFSIKSSKMEYCNWERINYRIFGAPAGI